MVEQSYQLVVIGDHLGGLAAAALEARRGRRVLLFEDTSNPPEERPLEYLNAICGGPENESGLGPFFHELGLSPFGPLGDDRIHFRPLHPPLQVILPRHRVNIYQDRVARNWEMEREFGDVREALREIRDREEAFRERLERFRSHRPRKGRVLRRSLSEAARFFRFRKLRSEAEKETFDGFLSSLSVPSGLGAVLLGQVCGVCRVVPGSLPWYVGLRSIQVLQGGLFRNAAGQSGIINGLREVFFRSGGESRPLVNLEGVDAVRSDAVSLHVTAGGRVGAERLLVDLPLERGLALLPPDVARGLQRKGVDRRDEEKEYGLLRLKMRRGWRPECMGDYLVVDPAVAGKSDGPTILVALQPVDPAGDSETWGIEVLGLFPPGGKSGNGAGELRRAMEGLMPFLDRGLAGEPSYVSGRLPVYSPQARVWRVLERYYRTGRGSAVFQSGRLVFLRNELYVGTDLAAGLLSGIWAVG